MSWVPEAFLASLLGAVASFATAASAAHAQPSTGSSPLWAFCHAASTSESNTVAYSPVVAIPTAEGLRAVASSGSGTIEYLADRDGLAEGFVRQVFGASSQGMHFYSCGAARDRSVVEAVRTRGREKYVQDGYRIRDVAWAPAIGIRAATKASSAEVATRARAEAKEQAEAEFRRKEAEYLAANARREAALKAIADQNALNAQTAATSKAKYEQEMAKFKAEQAEYERKLEEQRKQFGSPR